MCVMTVSIQVDASYRTMENGRLRKESRVFSQEQAFLWTSAHSRPPQFLSIVCYPGSHSVDFTITIQTSNWDLYVGNILESLVYGLSWLQIVCKMFCREKVSGAGLFSPWDVEEMLSDCWYLFWKTFRHGRVRLLHLIPVPTIYQNFTTMTKNETKLWFGLIGFWYYGKTRNEAQLTIQSFSNGKFSGNQQPLYHLHTKALWWFHVAHSWHFIKYANQMCSNPTCLTFVFHMCRMWQTCANTEVNSDIYSSSTVQ